MDGRRLVPQWDVTLIAASIGISLLGAFTSTQLMCQAKASHQFAGALVWTALGSLTFGFCSIWGLHEVAMLAYGLDLRIGIDVGLTILSAILAVVFTFVALASDMLYDRYLKRNGKDISKPSRRGKSTRPLLSDARARMAEEGGLEPLLPHSEDEYQDGQLAASEAEHAIPRYNSEPQQRPSITVIQPADNGGLSPLGSPIHQKASTRVVQLSQFSPREQTQFAQPSSTPHRDSQISTSSHLDSEAAADTESYQATVSQDDSSRRSSSFATPTASALGLGDIMGIKRFRNDSAIPTNPFAATYKTLHAGLNVANIVKGFIWAIAVTSMHYVGIQGLRVPQGHVSLNSYLVLLSFVICWGVCVVGCILILGLETHLGQQLLFSVVATCGVAAMRMYSTLGSFAEPSLTKRSFTRFHRNASSDVLLSRRANQ